MTAGLCTAAHGHGLYVHLNIKITRRIQAQLSEVWEDEEGFNILDGRKTSVTLSALGHPYLTKSDGLAFAFKPLLNVSGLFQQILHPKRGINPPMRKKVDCEYMHDKTVVQTTSWTYDLAMCALPPACGMEDSNWVIRMFTVSPICQGFRCVVRCSFLTSLTSSSHLSRSFFFHPMKIISAGKPGFFAKLISKKGKNTVWYRLQDFLQST
jgi:hypothetical protein